MKIPYKVVVTGNKDNINVTIDPQPTATSEDFLPVVSKRFQAIILEHSQAYTMYSKSNLRKAIIEALTDFHKQGMIKPKE